MPCHRPIDVFNRKAGHAYLVPCGKCTDCLNRKKNGWIFRIQQEQLHSNFKNCFFITLSYDDKYLPFESFSDIRKGEKVGLVQSDESVLNPYDLRMFIKRFRLYSGEPLSYFAVGEYGDPNKTERPHYHIILFTNLNWEQTLNMTRVCWSRLRPETSRERYQRYKLSKKLGYLVKRSATDMRNRESFGRDQVRSVTFRRICYVAKYVNKLIESAKAVQCFYRASNGLGKSFLDTLECKMLSAQNMHFARFENQMPVALPRYFSQRMFTLQQMEEFQLSLIISNDCPCPPDDFEACRKWYNERCNEVQAKRRAANMRFNYVRKWS